MVEDLTNIINDDEYFKFLNEIKNDIFISLADLDIKYCLGCNA